MRKPGILCKSTLWKQFILEIEVWKLLLIAFRKYITSCGPRALYLKARVQRHRHSGNLKLLLTDIENVLCPPSRNPPWQHGGYVGSPLGMKLCGSLASSSALPKPPHIHYLRYILCTMQKSSYASIARIKTKPVLGIWECMTFKMLQMLLIALIC